MTLKVMLEDGYMLIPRVDWYFICLLISGAASLYFWYRVLSKYIFEEYALICIHHIMRREMFL